MRKFSFITPQELESVVNNMLGLSATQGSGSLKGNGDGLGKDPEGVTYSRLLNDSKFTNKEASSISVLRSDWDKTEKAAHRYGRIPIMTRGDLTGRVFVVMDLDDFSWLYRMALETIKKE